MSLFLFAAWFLLSIIPAAIASRKGRSEPSWFLLSLLISPLFAGIIVACLGPIKENIEARALLEGMKKCLFCAELVKSEAKVSRYCQRDLDLPSLPISRDNAQVTKSIPPDLPQLADRQSEDSTQAKAAASVRPFTILNGDGNWLFDLPVGVATKLIKRKDALGDFIRTACAAGQSDIPKIIAACGNDPNLKFIVDAMQKAIPPVTLSIQDRS